MTASDTVTPIPLLSATVRLVAVPMVVGVARSYTQHTLNRWGLKDHADVAAFVMSELVTNAVKASGVNEQEPKPWQIKPEHVIGVQLRAIETSLFVEVWDRADQAPVRKNPDLDTEGGRGLLLVEQLTKCWGVHRSEVGGKIVWAELPLEAPVEEQSSEHGYLPMQFPQGIRALRGPVEEVAHAALFERLMTTTVTAMSAARVHRGT